MNAYELGKVLAKQAAVKRGALVGGGILGALGGLLGGAGYGAVESAFTDTEDPERGRVRQTLGTILRRALAGAAIGTAGGALLGARMQPHPRRRYR